VIVHGSQLSESMSLSPQTIEIAAVFSLTLFLCLSNFDLFQSIHRPCSNTLILARRLHLFLSLKSWDGADFWVLFIVLTCLGFICSLDWTKSFFDCHNKLCRPIYLLIINFECAFNSASFSCKKMNNVCSSFEKSLPLVHTCFVTSSRFEGCWTVEIILFSIEFWYLLVSGQCMLILSIQWTPLNQHGTWIILG
jgi:hypothetical protein